HRAQQICRHRPYGNSIDERIEYTALVSQRNDRAREQVVKLPARADHLSERAHFAFDLIDLTASDRHIGERLRVMTSDGGDTHLLTSLKSSINLLTFASHLRDGFRCQSFPWPTR